MTFPHPFRLLSIRFRIHSPPGGRIVAVGTPGHGSRPHEDNSAVPLMRALLRLAGWDRGITLTPETRDYLERLLDRF